MPVCEIAQFVNRSEVTVAIEVEKTPLAPGPYQDFLLDNILHQRA